MILGELGVYDRLRIATLRIRNRVLDFMNELGAVLLHLGRTFRIIRHRRNP